MQRRPLRAPAHGPGGTDRCAGASGVDEATAAAHFELGQSLHRAGRSEDAARQFRAAHRLQPANWTYKRQAWSLADPEQGPTDLYESDWLSEVQKVGAENYYPPLRMD